MKKDCLTTFSKVDFNTFEPEEDKIRIEDIAHALSMMTRANGHFPQFFSVGQHCIQCCHEATARNYLPQTALACLLHDVLVVITFYALARVSVSNTFIACLLTIVGYSINATIVIFDRVRENMAVMTKKDDLQDVVNHSITQTLSRSLFTSLTTLVMVGALYIWGVTSIRDFALPLMVGIICGAYSSVCIAGALWYVLRKKFAPKAK